MPVVWTQAGVLKRNAASQTVKNRGRPAAETKEIAIQKNVQKTTIAVETEAETEEEPSPSECKLADINKDISEFLGSLLNLEKTRGNTVCYKSREVIGRVNAFMVQLSTILGPFLDSFKDPLVLTEAATLMSRNTIVQSSSSAALLSSMDIVPVLPPCKEIIPLTVAEKEEKLISKLPDDYLGNLRYVIHQQYGEGRPITVKELNQLLKEEFPEFELNKSDTTLWRVLKASGITFKKLNDRVILYEDARLTRLRHSYLSAVKIYRESNAFLVFLDESWLFEGYRKSTGWVNNDALENPSKYLKLGWKLGPSPCPSKGKRAIIVGAICESGIVEGSFKVICDGGDVIDGDYHKKMNAPIFESWFSSILLKVKELAGDRVPVVIMDNASYHCRPITPIPTTNSNKDDLVYYLTNNGVSCSSDNSKAELLAFLNNFLEANGGRRAVKEYVVDEMASLYGIEVLRLPPHHCQLNAIEHWWGYLKTMLAKKTTGAEKLEELRLHSLEIINAMEPQMAKNFFDSACHEEDKFIAKEHLVFVDLNDSDSISPPDYTSLDPYDFADEIQYNSEEY